MKTREELEAMTKEEIDAYAKEAFGVDLDRRLAKEKLIEATLALQEQQQNQQPEAIAPADQAEQEAAKPSGVVTVTITKSNQRPVHLSVNGKTITLPVGKPTMIPASMLPALADAVGITFTTE